MYILLYIDSSENRTIAHTLNKNFIIIMRRKVGVSALKKKQDEVERYSKVGKSLEDLKLSAISDVMTKFKTTLSEFANKHRGRKFYVITHHLHSVLTFCYAIVR